MYPLRWGGVEGCSPLLELQFKVLRGLQPCASPAEVPPERGHAEHSYVYSVITHSTQSPPQTVFFVVGNVKETFFFWILATGEDLKERQKYRSVASEKAI